MTIRDALLNLCFGYKSIRRKAWGSGTSVFITVENGMLYIHSHSSDVFGRGWQPSFEELTQSDWECL